MATTKRRWRLRRKSPEDKEKKQLDESWNKLDEKDQLPYLYKELIKVVSRISEGSKSTKQFSVCIAFLSFIALVLQTALLFRQNNIIDSQREVMNLQVSWDAFEQAAQIRQFMHYQGVSAPDDSKAKKFWSVPNMALVYGLHTLGNKEQEQIHLPLEHLTRDPNHTISSTAVLALIKMERVVKGALLSQADLEHQDLSHGVLLDSDLRGVNLFKAMLFESNLSGSNLCGIVLDEAAIENSVFDRCQMNGPEFKGVKANGSEFKYINLEEADFSKVEMKQSVWLDAELPRATFQYARLSGANFDDTTLSGANFQMAIIDKKASFRSALLNNAFFNGANLQGADLRSAWLMNTDFSPFKARVSLYKTQLAGANFYNVDIEKCNFSDANLQNADFRITSVKNCILMNADFGGADLRGANLIDNNQFGGTVSFHKAKFDEYTMIPLVHLKDQVVILFDRGNGARWTAKGSLLYYDDNGKLRKR